MLKKSYSKDIFNNSVFIVMGYLPNFDNNMI